MVKAFTVLRDNTYTMADSQRDSPVTRVTVCLACGDKADTNKLVYCRNCHDSVVHPYCMDDGPHTDVNINWWCWDCAPKDSKSEKLRKSERISSKRKKVQQNKSIWKERLNQSKKLIQLSNGINEIAQSSADGHLPASNLELSLSDERRRGEDLLEEKKLVPVVPSHSEEPNESIKLDELKSRRSLALQDENNEKWKVGEVKKKKRILILNDSSDSSEEEGNDYQKTTDLQVPSFVSNGHCIASDTLHGQSFLEPDDCHTAEAVIDPTWRGWFNIKRGEEETETSLEIFAHLSNKASSKVSNAATAIPPMVDIQVLEKLTVWPKSFRVSPPTAASIALYFFPACERDERVFDILLDEVLERDLALKAMVDNAELLIFSSCELPLEHWRYNSKYYLWGVFRQKRPEPHSRTHYANDLTQRNSSTEGFELSESKAVANNELVLFESANHLISSRRHPNESSPLSMNSSQASNRLPSKHNTPDSRPFFLQLS